MDLTQANKDLIATLNSSFRKFYKRYAAYSNEDFTVLCQNISETRPDLSLERCVEFVQDTLSRARKQKNEQFTAVKGIYLLIDEYDAFTNNYLEPPDTIEPRKIIWEDTEVEHTLRSFWSMVKILRSNGIERVFVTGISPLSYSTLGSGFNVARNLSFHQNLAGLCGLTRSDLEDVLKECCEDSEAHEHLSKMTKFFNGYHFCNYTKVGTVYNTETCLAYLQSVVDGGDQQTENPPNSEVSQQLLEKFTTSPFLIVDFENAIKCDEKGEFLSLKYNEVKVELALSDLTSGGTQSSYRSLMVYFGGLTFDPKDPKNFLKIPNNVAASRIASAVLRRYKLSQSLAVALQTLDQDGDIGRVLNCYRELMTQRDISVSDLIITDEGKHRDSFYFSLLRNHNLLPRAEFPVTKADNQNGRIDLLIKVPGKLIVTEWKFYRIQFLDIRARDGAIPVVLTKAAILSNYNLSEILQLKFIDGDQHHHGTIKSWVMGKPCQQLRDYIKSAEVTQLVKNQGLEMRAHLVIIVGSRHILLWDMDKDGKLASEPRLVE